MGARSAPLTGAARQATPTHRDVASALPMIGTGLSTTLSKTSPAGTSHPGPTRHKEHEMNRKEWEAAMKKVAHRKTPIDQWGFAHVIKEFHVQVYSRAGEKVVRNTLFQMNHRTNVKKTEIGLRYLRDSFGLTPQEAAAYIPDFFRDRPEPLPRWRSGKSNDYQARFNGDWVQYLQYVQVRGLARRGRSHDFAAERKALRSKIFPPSVKKVPAATPAASPWPERVEDPVEDYGNW